MIQTSPERENTLGISSSILASSTHISNLIVLQNPNRACLISSKCCKLLKIQLQLKPLPFSSPPSYSILCYIFFCYRAFLLNPLRRKYALGVVFELHVPPECNSLRTCVLLSIVENSPSSLLRQRIQGEEQIAELSKDTITHPMARSS